MCSRHTFFSRVVLYITELWYIRADWNEPFRRVFRASRRTSRKLRHHHHHRHSRLSQPTGRFPFLASRVRAFPSTFGSQKASSRTELSRFILSTRAGLRLFCLLARGHLNCAPVPFKRPFFSPQPFTLRREPRKNAQPCTILRKAWPGIAEATKGAAWERRRRKRKGSARERRMTYLMIFAAAKRARRGRKKGRAYIHIRGKATTEQMKRIKIEYISSRL